MDKNNNLFTQAVADAKAVKEMAIQNAKDSIHEAFGNNIQNIIKAKLAEEAADDEELEDDSLDENDGLELEEGNYDLDEDDSYDLDEEEDLDLEEGDELELDLDEDDHMEDELEEGDEMDLDLDEEEDLDLDLDEEEEIDLDLDEEEEMDLDLDESDDMDADDLEEGNYDLDEDDSYDLDEEEELDLDLDEEEEEMVPKSELDEAKKAIRYLRSTLNEVNLLNSKLLYTSKIFKANNLTEARKRRVLEAFDRVTKVSDVKKVYESITKQLTPTKKSINRSRTVNVIKEGRAGASRVTGSTKPRSTNIIVDEDVARMQKLAGINKR